MRPPLLLLCCALLVSPALAQQPGDVRIRSAPYHPPTATIAVDANLVELAVTVRDHQGQPLGGFQQSDFEVLDDLKPRPITFFAEQHAGEPPREAMVPTHDNPSPPPPAPSNPQTYIALFFDDTHAGMAGFERSKKAAEKLIAARLRPADRVGIFTASGAVALDFTADTRSLLDTVAKLRRQPDAMSKGFGACPTLTAYQAYMIARHLDLMAKAVAVADIKICDPMIPQAIAEAQAQTAAENAWDQLRPKSAGVLAALMVVVRRLSAAPGARTLLMVSPGFVTADLERQVSALTDACLRHRIVFSALDEEGLLSSGVESPESLGARSGPRVGWAGRTLGLRSLIVTGFMADAAASTGGRFIHNDNDLTQTLDTLAAVPVISYLLGFSPSQPPDGKYHKLKVNSTKAGNHQISARPGYFSLPPGKPAETAQQRIDRVVASGELLDQIPAAVTVQVLPDTPDRYRIQVNIRVDARSLPFSALNGASVQQLTFVTVLEDANGRYLEGKQAVMDLSLPAASRTRFEHDGIHAATSFVAPKGAYRIREVIREAVHNQLTACISPIQVK